jgi:hypothetical protein
MPQLIAGCQVTGACSNKISEFYNADQRVAV